MAGGDDHLQGIANVIGRPYLALPYPGILA